MNERILLIGSGGHCKSVLDSLIELNQYEEIGIIGETKEQIGNTLMGIPVIASDDDLPRLFKMGFKHAFISIGSIGNPHLRIRLHHHLESIGFTIPNIIDRTVSVSRFAELDQGIFVGKQAIINSGTTIHKGAIINSGAIVEHDCIIGQFVHIASGVVVGGGVKVGDQTHIGLNTTVKQQIQIGSRSIIGMGSVVTKDVESECMAYGNPCRKVMAI